MTLNILLYKKTYNKNICFCYTRRRIIKYLFLLYKKTYNETNILLYKKMYDDIKYFII